LAAGRLQFVHRRQDYHEVCGGEASAHRGAGQKHERGRCSACRIRSTCRIRILGDLSALPPASAAERYVVIMFVDLCGSSKGACPSTRSFVISQFLTAVSRGIVAAGGEPNQILGDGLLASFGLKGPPADACRAAIAACVAIASNVTTGSPIHG